MDLRSFKTPSFNKGLEKLSPEGRRLAQEAFVQWARSEGSSSKKLNRDSQAISVRVTESVRAVGLEVDAKMPGVRAVCWFFIGKHSDYEHLLNSRKLEDSLSRLREKLPLLRERMAAGAGKVRPKGPPA